MIWKDSSVATTGDWPLVGEPFQVEVDAPPTVKAGETFTLSITATNIGDGRVSLNSIDLYDTLVEGFKVVQVSPRSSDQMNLMEFHSYYFEGLNLDAGESTTVRFELKAVKPGDWSGDVDCCTPSESFSSATVAIEVTE